MTAKKRGRKPEGDEKLYPVTTWLPREIVEWIRRRGRPSEVLREQVTRDYQERGTQTK